ncbi:MAG: hypothetical protein A2046_05965 [Bacteroidetes bacterium GWA2_30_7]|nr:MAG: hypothetical protein A2046_05965 [Bacteroidetes bacterium GWA2_30_7]
MENSFSILIWLNKSKKNSKNLAPIYGRITVNGKRAEIALKLFIEIERWDSTKGRARGNKEDSRLINITIENFLNKARRVYEQLTTENAFISAENIKNIILGANKKKIMLLEAFDIHLKDIESKINIDYVRGTYNKYNNSMNHLKSFIKEFYKRNDLELLELDYSFISKFDFFLKVKLKNSQNSTYKHIQRLRKIINLAVLNDWLEKDPFNKFIIKQESRERGFLSSEELEMINSKYFFNKRLENIKDIFMFSCYTGFAYIDIYNLTEDNIFLGIDGEKWIKINRQKTGTPSSVPLLPKALEIIEKYKNISSEKLLPVISNQRTNSYLKEIADLCGIKKILTFHMARHTFATTVTLTNGVPIETVSKMLGHKSIKTTQIYSKVVEQKVSYDMKLLKNKLLYNESRKSIN